MNKVLTLTLATACSALLLAEPVSSQSIVVTPEVSRAQFVENLSADLDRQLIRATRWDDAYGEGITIVRFTRDADGEPADVQLHRRSGQTSLDRTAIRAVKRLDSLDRVPAGLQDDQVYQANIIFATSHRSMTKLSDKLAKEEAARLARGAGQTRVLAFGSAGSRPSS